MSKKYYGRLVTYLDKIMSVSAAYAQKHFDELAERVCRENIAIIVQDEDGSVVMAPYWWYQLSFGLDPKDVITTLFKQSRFIGSTEILKFIVVANGYINMTTPDSAQELLSELLPLLERHPHSVHWSKLLDKLATYWDEDHRPRLIIAAFGEDRKVYLLFTDGKTRVVDMRKFIGHGLEEADLEDEEYFRDSLTLVTEALAWMPVAGEMKVVFFSEGLLRESEPVDDEIAKEIWELPKYDPIE